MNISGTLIGGLAIAGVAAFAGSQVQKRIDNHACDVRIQEVRAGAVKALNDLSQINLNLTAERDQAKAEVDKVNDGRQLSRAPGDAGRRPDKTRRSLDPCRGGSKGGGPQCADSRRARYGRAGSHYSSHGPLRWGCYP